MEDSEPRKRFRDPSELSFESSFLRRCILAAYWVVVLLAMPGWWQTTSIERLSLPTSQVLAQAKREISFPLNIYLSSNADDTDLNALSSKLEQLLQTRLSGPVSVRASKDVPVSPDSGSYSVKLTGEPGDELSEDGILLHHWDTSDSTATKALADKLTALLSPYADTHEREHVVSKYASRYRIAFTLLNEDAASGKSALSWEIRKALSLHIRPLLKRLESLHNFTIESQVQYHAPLAFSPSVVSANGSEVYGLTPEDLTVFVNSAEWTLSSGVTNDPVLHLLLFVPSPSRRPLHILDSAGVLTTSHSFILPQWGGVTIYNPPADMQDHFDLTARQLNKIVPIFRNQLSSLLGVPRLPKGIKAPSPGCSVSSWQIDALLRRRTVENVREAQQTLESIVKLVEQIENMPVGKDVKQDVEGALRALDQAFDAATLSPKLAFDHSNDALTLASRAFFNPGMLALLYFPPEHRLAVYTPLFASATVPLVVAVLREFMAWKKQRKAAAAAALQAPRAS
ncbi:hypothetical protein GLOTRDRAFT_80455 [Gloeophyllum trabeum ATCC 11539]|uniref:GPI transamidase component PIG-S n=1 Tax=Gloeophyllum trabeum (strain ATCC 11539 / FP-39264 / Madison 617) TaxID=670483 RepID=S7PY05_GLOTA|nr:uncharacterized protein GLOTRDRAFT_80455 [Gloeophyllum trabeum ATCC 11539]EPQ52232.1 hypothetical protein GLOTRDRAFT_80455 [Gloeophyllum trabeum ATCC 11539]